MASRGRAKRPITTIDRIRATLGVENPTIEQIAEVFKKTGATFGTAPAKSVAQEWRVSFRKLISMFPHRAKAPSWASIGEFAISNVYANGMIVGTCNSDSATYNLFANRETKGSLAGCSCESSQGRYACVHNFKFVEFILDELSDAEFRTFPEDRKRGA